MKSRSPQFPLGAGVTLTCCGNVLPWSRETSTTGNDWDWFRFMNDTYRAPSGATATAGSQAPREPGMFTGVLHVFPALADRAKAIDGPPSSQIQAAYTSWRQVASSTSALPPPQKARLRSVTGP